MFIQVNGEWVLDQVMDIGLPDVPADGGGTVERQVSLGNIADNDLYLANSAFQGLMDNVKVWNTDEQPTQLVAEVNTVSGELVLKGGVIGRTFGYYQLTSASGSLNPANWNSLSTQNLDQVGDGSGVGETWEEVTNQTTELTEAFLLGNTTLADGDEVSLGNIFGAAPGLGVEDGDYNGNNVVDAPDYNVWRDNFGAEVDPLTVADGNGNGSIDAPDYNVWRDNFGAQGGGGGGPAEQDLVLSIVTTAGPGAVTGTKPVPVVYINGAGASVPEPSCLLLAFMGLVGLAAVRRN